MNTQDYISSGVIESCVLGFASEEEVRELEMLCDQYPEIKQARDEAEHSLTSYAVLHSVAPPAGLKQSIFETLVNSGDLVPGNTNADPETKIISIQDNSSQPSLSSADSATNVRRLYKFSAVAASILLLIFAAFHFYTVNNLKDRIAALEIQQESLLTQNSELENQVGKSNLAFNIISDPGIKNIPLAGVNEHQNNNASIYWDTRSGEVYLFSNNLPAPPAGKQYQLWAIVDGKPVSAGMYNSNEPGLQKMISIERSEMFAITLENEGGVESPTMEQMYVAGKVS